jgi:8-oxo-dGTP diphosphatase
LPAQGNQGGTSEAKTWTPQALEGVKAKNRRSGRKMSDAIFVTAKSSGHLTIGDKKEIDKAAWRKPRGIRLTSTSRYIRDKLFPKSS